MEGGDLAHKPDAVTRWWRGTSLRAKVTGVTVVLLAVGLFAAGVGTAVFLRTSLIDGVETQIEALARTQARAPQRDLTAPDGPVYGTPQEDAAPGPGRTRRPLVHGGPT